MTYYGPQKTANGLPPPSKAGGVMGMLGGMMGGGGAKPAAGQAAGANAWGAADNATSANPYKLPANPYLQAEQQGAGTPSWLQSLRNPAWSQEAQNPSWAQKLTDAYGRSRNPMIFGFPQYGGTEDNYGMKPKNSFDITYQSPNLNAYSTPAY